MKTAYNKTRWVDNSTPVNAENLNNIENGISGLYSNALGLSELIEGNGIEIKNKVSDHIKTDILIITTIIHADTVKSEINAWYSGAIISIDDLINEVSLM